MENKFMVVQTTERMDTDLESYMRRGVYEERHVPNFVTRQCFKPVSMGHLTLESALGVKDSQKPEENCIVIEYFQ